MWTDIQRVQIKIFFIKDYFNYNHKIHCILLLISLIHFNTLHTAKLLSRYRTSLFLFSIILLYIAFVFLRLAWNPVCTGTRLLSTMARRSSIERAGTASLWSRLMFFTAAPRKSATPSSGTFRWSTSGLPARSLRPWLATSITEPSRWPLTVSSRHPGTQARTAIKAASLLTYTSSKTASTRTPFSYMPFGPAITLAWCSPRFLTRRNGERSPVFLAGTICFLSLVNPLILHQ